MADGAGGRRFNAPGPFRYFTAPPVMPEMMRRCANVKMTTEISVLVPKGFYALSNGELTVLMENHVI